MKGTHPVRSLVSIYSQPLVNVLSSMRVNLTQLVGRKLCQVGHMYHCHPAQLVHARLSRRTYSGYRAMKRLSCSSIMTQRAVRRRRNRQAYYHLERSRSLAYLVTTRTHQMRCNPGMLRPSTGRSGMPKITAQTVLLTVRHYLS